MAKLRTTPEGRRIPGYSHHKPSGRAYVRINGKHFGLGVYDPSEGSPSMELYRRLIAEWRANGFRTPSLAAANSPTRGVPSVRDLTAWFLTWAEKHYSRSEFLLCRQGLALLCSLYGAEAVTSVGVSELRAARNVLLERGADGKQKPLARKTVNALIGRVQRAFRHAASEGQIPPEAATGVSALQPLKKGRTDAPDYAPREPAFWDDVAKVLPHLTPQVAAIIEALWHTGARIGEMCLIRSRDVDMTGPVWVFRPEHHKTAHHGQQRVVAIGPKAQAVLRRFVKLAPDRYWFNAIDESLAQQEAWSAATPEERKKLGLRCARPGAVKRESLDPRAIERRLREACKKAGVRFTSHQLRHAALTRIRDEHGIESARLIAGQHSELVTRGYTHTIETKKASEVAGRSG